MNLDKHAVVFFLLLLFCLISAPGVGHAQQGTVNSKDNSHSDTLEQGLNSAHGDSENHGQVNLGELLHLYTCIPFACMLL